MKLRTKIPVLLVPLIIAPLLFVGRFAYTELRAAGEARVFADMHGSLNQLRIQMSTIVDTAHSNIDLFAKQPLVEKYLFTLDDEERYSLLQPALLRLFASYQEAFPEYYEIRIFLPNGYEDARQTRPYIANLSEEEGDSALFKAMQLAGDETYTSVFRNPDNGNISLFTGKPLKLTDRAVDGAGVEPNLRGYVGLTIALNSIESQIRQDVVGASGYLFATDRSGKTMFESAEQPVGNTLPAALVSSLLYVDQERAPQVVTFNGQSTYIMGVELLPELYAFAALPESELLSISHELGLVVAGTTIIAIILALMLMMAAMEYFVIRPIHRLTALSGEIGRGNWTGRVSGVDGRDEISELAYSLADMAENLQNSNEQVRYLAYHDSLTGLPNRTMFNEYLGRSIAYAQRNDQLLAVLFLDIDNFKTINDTLGHQAGDILLQKVGDRLAKSLRTSDCVTHEHEVEKPDEVVARLGGDEFIILLPGIPGAHTAGVVAHRIIKVLQDPIVVVEQECHISVSIGITVFPADGDNIDQLIKNADIAMYHAKEEGKNTYHYFQDSMNAAVMDRLKLEVKLRQAIANEHFTLHYQPQVNCVSQEIVGVEALLRWEDPEEGSIPPNEFIALAESSGLILPIGEWVIHEVCRQSRIWQNEGCLPGLISVNVSPVQFARQDIAAILREALNENQLEPGCLEIEITESAVMPDLGRALDVINDIKSLGVHLALDDFGTGFSSLSYLRQLPVTTLKIDRSFILEIDQKEEDAEIVGAITAMAHILELRVVVEGIESQAQLDVIRARKCDVVQGYLFSKPVTAEEVQSLLQGGAALADAS